MLLLSENLVELDDYWSDLMENCEIRNTDIMSTNKICGHIQIIFILIFFSLKNFFSSFAN